MMLRCSASQPPLMYALAMQALNHLGAPLPEDTKPAGAGQRGKLWCPSFKCSCRSDLTTAALAPVRVDGRLQSQVWGPHHP